ncbi:MAG: trimethylamine methyltransferase family protein [Acidimicrobiales bacterium]|nr:trimethylamine methyltransferase family protein [Acidimicrobiaceae bacterium]MBT5567606.1 trimethylamine methyltransferase family protein [Acidimicrobiaceae bacterium]MBT6092884.1 trimethylamine methyltransferase family protein [Acidimicrobiaceae bacterium]MDG2161703.1 trimethylamine methyltransferase family protein [Acidimicrobiales bacterium]
MTDTSTVPAQRGVRQGRDARAAKRRTRVQRWLPELERRIPWVDLLDDEQVKRIHDASMDIIEEVGVEFRCDDAIGMWRAAGADVDGVTVRIDREHLMSLVGTAPSSYTMVARDPAHTVTVGDGRTIFTPSYGAPYVLDLDGVRRPGTLQDFRNFTKLNHLSPALHMSGGVVCEPMDVPVPKRHLYMTESLLKYSSKPFMGAVTSMDRAEDSLHMAGIVFGQDFVRETTVMTSLANANTPLVWDKTMLDSVRVFAAANQATLFSPFVLGGASTPASTVGAVIQVNIEALTGVAFSQLVRAGAPALYGQWLSTVSMRTGAPQAGTPEICHMNLLTAQMARHYNLPSRCSGSCTSSKMVDAQAGYEAARNMYGVIMAGTNFVLSTTGYLESAMCQSYAKWVLDSEQLELMYRLGSGVSFDGLDEVLDSMRSVPAGGHHLGTEHTLANFQTAFSMPEMMNSDNYEQWLADGSQSAEERAAARCRQMLDEYEEPALDDHIREELDDYVARRDAELPDLVT